MLLVCLVTTLLGLWLLSPTIYKIYNPEAEEVPAGMPNTPMTLGLDLQGGVHMVLGVDLEKYNQDQLQIYKRDLQGVLSEREGIKDVKVNYLPARREI